VDDVHEEINVHIRELIAIIRRARLMDLERLREAVDQQAGDGELVEIAGDVAEWTRTINGYTKLLPEAPPEPLRRVK
jgi:hypothetical protein